MDTWQEYLVNAPGPEHGWPVFAGAAGDVIDVADPAGLYAGHPLRRILPAMSGKLDPGLQPKTIPCLDQSGVLTLVSEAGFHCDVWQTHLARKVDEMRVVEDLVVTIEPPAADVHPGPGTHLVTLEPALQEESTRRPRIRCQ